MAGARLCQEATIQGFPNLVSGVYSLMTGAVNRINCTRIAAALSLCAISAFGQFALGQAASGQSKPPKELNPVQLQLTMEVAATTRGGVPAAIRVTLTNAGYVAVDLPMPGSLCSGEDGALNIRMEWHSNDPNDHSGVGWGCGSGYGDRAPLLERARDDWMHLLPGEFLTVTENIRSKVESLAPGRVEFWAEYTPPLVNSKEMTELKAAGYAVPTEELVTERQNFALD